MWYRGSRAEQPTRLIKVIQKPLWMSHAQHFEVPAILVAVNADEANLVAKVYYHDHPYVELADGLHPLVYELAVTAMMNTEREYGFGVEHFDRVASNLAAGASDRRLYTLLATYIYTTRRDDQVVDLVAHLIREVKEACHGGGGCKAGIVDLM